MTVKKKHMLLILGVVLLALVFLYGVKQTGKGDSDDGLVEVDLPPMLMVGEDLYQLEEDVTDKENSLSEPDGVITEVKMGQVPSEDGQANFGSKNMNYWEMDENILVKWEDNLLKFKKTENIISE